MNTIDELIEVLQGVKAGRKWGYRDTTGVLRKYNSKSVNEVVGMIGSYTVELMPETTICNGIEISAPLRVAPVDGKRYYEANPCHEDFFEHWHWDGDDVDNLRLRRGLIHATQEAAAAHGKAMCGVRE